MAACSSFYELSLFLLGLDALPPPRSFIIAHQDFERFRKSPYKCCCLSNFSLLDSITSPADFVECYIFFAPASIRFPTTLIKFCKCASLYAFSTHTVHENQKRSTRIHTHPFLALLLIIKCYPHLTAPRLATIEKKLGYRTHMSTYHPHAASNIVYIVVRTYVPQPP